MLTVLYTSQVGDMVGGGQKSLLLLLERLDRKTIKPLLCCPSSGSLTARASTLGIETHEIRVPPSLKRISPAALVKCVGLLKGKRIDIVHTDSPRMAVYFGLGAKITGRPHIFHARVAGEARDRHLDRLLLALSNAVIAVSHAAADRFEGMRHCPEKVRVIYNGTVLDEPSTVAERNKWRAELGLSANDVAIGSAGQIIPTKGFELLLQAAALVRPKAPGTIKYIIIGQGTDEYVSYLKKRAQDLGLAQSVIFTGFRKDVTAILGALNIFVLASLYKEGLSRVLIEAMAACLPVIAFDTGGNREVIEPGENGLLLEKGNVMQLAEAIEKLAVDETCRKAMGAKGRELAEKKFNINDNAAKIQNVYTEVLARRTRPNGKEP